MMERLVVGNTLFIALSAGPAFPRAGDAAHISAQIKLASRNGADAGLRPAPQRK
jgi:hypothetical protein